MISPPIVGQDAFEVTVYNKDVRALVKDNRSHWYYDDHWADVHMQDIVALDETEARAEVIRRFPPEDGFVVERLVRRPQ